MATYPALDGKGVATPANKTQFTQSDGTQIRGQRFTSQTIYDITITHELLSVAEVNTLQDFFDTNRNTTITTQVFDDGESYTGKLLLEPELVVVNGTYSRVTQKLFGTRV